MSRASVTSALFGLAAIGFSVAACANADNYGTSAATATQSGLKPIPPCIRKAGVMPSPCMPLVFGNN